MNPNDYRPTAQAANSYGRILGAAGGLQLAACARRAERPALTVALYQAEPYDIEVPPLAVSRLSINLTASLVSGGVQGERRRSFEAARHSMFLTPAQTPTAWRKALPSRHLNIYFDAELGLGEPEPAIANTLARPMFNVLATSSSALIDEIATELRSPGPLTAEAVECLARLLLVRLARRHTSHQGAQMLSAPLLKRVEDFVQAHLHQRLLVSDLAAVVGLPPQAFARAFVRYTGRSPHQFVMTQRIEQAVSLLRGSSLPLAEVAQRCGFGNQQHMTHVLSKRLMQSPAGLRDSGLPKRNLR